jgi:peptidoglycan/xylan/chitin deacetylase (PgdA/CDA1 family)
MDGITDNIPPENGRRVLYLTLNLSGGGYNAELVQWLADNNIPATFFVSVRWLLPERDTPARPYQFQQIYKNPLFRVENHGWQLLPASSNGKRAYGIRGTESLSALADEVLVAQTVLKNASDRRNLSTWYRAAGARYDSLAVRYILDSLNYKIAGFAVSDAGGTLSGDQLYDAMIRAESGAIFSITANLAFHNADAFDGFKRAITELRKRYRFELLP